MNFSFTSIYPISANVSRLLPALFPLLIISVPAIDAVMQDHRLRICSLNQKLLLLTPHYLVLESLSHVSMTGKFAENLLQLFGFLNFSIGNMNSDKRHNKKYRKDEYLVSGEVGIELN